MAYPYRGPQSPREEPQFSNFSTNPLSPPRNPNRLSAGMMSSSDVRASLTRRFTTNALPTLSPIGQQRRQAAGETQMPNGAYNRVAPSERRLRHIEGLLEQQRRIAAELEQVDDQTRREVEDGLRHERDITQMIAQSEPTTPPEYQDGFSSSVTRPNRYSTTSLTSPPGITNNRAHRSSTQLASPAGGFTRPYTATNNNNNLPSQSVPGSRRQSDGEEEEDDFVFGGYESTIHRAAAKPNRNSMPATSYDRKRSAADLSSVLGPLNTTSFLFDENEKPAAFPSKSNKTSPPDIKTYLQMQHTADGFPKLIRREENGEPATGSSAALDLALSQLPNSDQQVTERATASRHRISLPPSALSSIGNIAPLNSILANANDLKSAAHNRRSMEVKFTAETKRPSLGGTPPHLMSNGVAAAHPSYSTNDIPTLKSINDENSGGVSINSPSAQASSILDATSTQQINGRTNRVTSTGSIPTDTNNRQNQDFTPIAKPQESNLDTFQPQAGLQGATTSSGAMHSQDSNPLNSYPSPTMSPYAQAAFYGGYGVQMMNNGFSNMSLGGGYGAQGQYPNQAPPYQQGGYSGYQQFPQNGQVAAGAGRYPDNNNRMVMQQRKAQSDEFFNSVALPDLAGQIYGLCKDQHGCRFLQRKLEENKDHDVQMIFDEVKAHFTELMVDPFGNYLCQRLLEYSNDEQRTILIENASPDMTKIALNQHGTRALQKMIEFISTHEQTGLIIQALKYDVVQLIQDLNGNHVIQKCLNHLSPHDAQFIFDAVGANCVAVGTHRHGCCVLQRCVDHATGLQKGALVDCIIAEAYALVQDPFGNYVVQYILDLSEPCFTEPLCRSFVGSVALLSKQKFSSNVIEKCMRCASHETKRMLIHEISPTNELERLLRDSFANYVVQTAMDFADNETKGLLFENVRPILPTIRHTPYGRRIQTKIQEFDAAAAGGIASTNSMAPLDSMTATAPYAGGFPTGRGNRMGMVGPSPWANANGFGGPGAVNGYPNGGEINAPAPQRSFQAYEFINGAQNYQNFQGNGFGGQGFGRAQPYGHF